MMLYRNTARALILGFGIGVFQVSFAALFSRGFGERSGAVMNVMTTAFSFGSITGPFIIVVLLERFNIMFLIVAFLMVATTRRVLPARDTVVVQTSDSILMLEPRLVGFALLCLFYVAAEVGLNFWMPTYLQSVGFTPANSAKGISSTTLMPRSRR